MRALLIALFVCISANAQSREELRNKYGSPVSETFSPRPGVFLTVSYADTGEVCEMIIHPQQLTSAVDYPITKTMQSQELTKIIDEMIPVKQRGKRLLGGFLDLMCLPLNNCYGVLDNYERVTITRIGGNDKERYARIQWKATPCHD